MSLTLNQCTERAGRLAGELKAARELHAICAADLDAKEHAATLARQALKNAQDNITRLEDERAELAEQAKIAVLAKGEPLDLGDDRDAASDGHTLNAFANPIYENGVARLNSVFEEATHP